MLRPFSPTPMLRGRPALFVHVTGSAAHPEVRAAVSPWGGERVDRDLAFGLGPAIALLDDLDAAEPRPGAWPAEPDLVGGAVIDCTTRRLALFGGDDDLQSDVRVRRARLELLAEVWEGWDVTWASEGLAELADAALVPREAVLTPTSQLPYDLPTPPLFRRVVDALVTVRWDAATLSVHPASWDATELALAGPPMLELCRDEPRDAAFALGHPPHGGVHVDVALKLVRFWTAEPFADAVARVGRRWPGHAVRFDGDDPRPQFEACAGRLELDPLDRASARDAAVRRWMASRELGTLEVADWYRQRRGAHRPQSVDSTRPSPRLTREERAWILGRALVEGGAGE